MEHIEENGGFAVLQSLNFPLCSNALAEYESWDNLRRDIKSLGCDGVEGIWGGEKIPEDFPQDLLTGYHLTFFPDWLDFYRNDQQSLCRKFGSLETAYAFYSGDGPEALLNLYRADLERAMRLGAKYVVFHVSDVSVEEGYTYQWLHSDEEVLDASVEIINKLLAGVEPTFDFLVENQWWPGFTFTQPEKTFRLLDPIAYTRKGIMLDTGHLMNTNTTIEDQADGIAYIDAMLEQHGEMSRMIRGLHLHQSVSGGYVRGHTNFLPDNLPVDYNQRYCQSYTHIQRIDRHLPWTNPAVYRLVERIHPSYLTHELSAYTREEKMEAARRQINTLKKGRLLYHGRKDNLSEN